MIRLKRLGLTSLGERTCRIHKNCALLGYYAATSRNFLPTFRDNLSVPSSGFMGMGKILEPSGLARYNVPKCR